MLSKQHAYEEASKLIVKLALESPIVHERKVFSAFCEEWVCIMELMDAGDDTAAMQTALATACKRVEDRLTQGFC